MAARWAAGIFFIHLLMISAFSRVSWPISESFWISQLAVCVHVGAVRCFPMFTRSSSTMWMYISSIGSEIAWITEGVSMKPHLTPLCS